MTAGTDTFMPIFDPETGEVLAESEDIRRELVEDYAEMLYEAELCASRGEYARARLRLLMRPNDAVPTSGGGAVTCKPGAPARRSVVPHAMDDHAEALATVPGCAIREETVTRRVYPKVSDLITTKARDALALQGLTPEHFLSEGSPGEPKIVVVHPEAA